MAAVVISFPRPAFLLESRMLCANMSPGFRKPTASNPILKGLRGPHTTSIHSIVRAFPTTKWGECKKR